MERFLEDLDVAGEKLPRETVEAILAQHQASVRQVRQDAAVQVAVQNAGGRNLTAIKALLDMAALDGAEDLTAAAEKAVERVKGEHSYLFVSAVPPFSSGSGSPIEKAKPMTLAEALRLRKKRN